MIQFLGSQFDVFAKLTDCNRQFHISECDRVTAYFTHKQAKDFIILSTLLTCDTIIIL